MPKQTAATLDSFLQVSTPSIGNDDDDETEAELFCLQSEADDLHLKLASLQAKIRQLEAAYEPLQLKKPRTAAAAATWTAAGLGSTAELEEAILAIENWALAQPNCDTLTSAGWLTFLYNILEGPIRKAAAAVALQN